MATEAAAHRGALDAVELTALVAAGAYDDALPIARSAAGASTLDEGRHALLMERLHGVGRSSEALEVFAGLRGRLADRLGADPSARLIDLNATILRGDQGTRAQAGDGVAGDEPEPAGRICRPSSGSGPRPTSSWDGRPTWPRSNCSSSRRVW
ncbi:BTAD domain-containing putative transcriptional regulator [Prescottella defluvii]|nr:BTAD domain-containing putative transcriptional regulator [Prescottella defluvii]